jgi:uncharacterized protein (TIGR02246 family)
MKLALAALIAITAVAPALADTSLTCKATSEADIKGLFDRWNNSLKTGNPDEVVKNYAPDAILLATVSNKPRLTQDERRDYFVHFLEDKPVGDINMRVIKLGCNDAIDAGIYTFTFGNGQKVRARYTYTYTLQDGKWLISSHHSSAMPEKSD